MKRLLTPLGTLLVALAMVACSGNEIYWVNPDGSAKIHVSSNGPGVGLSNVFNYSEKIDAWSDIKVTEKSEDGPGSTAFTAYVADVSDFRINGPGNAPPVKKTADGGFELDFESKMRKPKPKDISDEEAKKELEKGRAEMGRMKAMMGRVGDGESTMTFFLPGEVTASKHFTKTDEGGYQLKVKVGKVLEVQQKIMEDEALALRLIKAGELPGGGPEVQKMMMEEVFGIADPLMLKSTGGGKPLFDYATEVKAAQDGLAETLAKSGMFPTELPPKPERTPHEKFELNFATEKENFRKKREIQLSFSSQADEDVIVIKNAEIVSAKDDKGGVLFPFLGASNMSNHSGFQKTSGRFSPKVNIAPLTEGATKLAEVNFLMEYGVAKEKEVIDLGTHDLSTPLEGGKNGLSFSYMTGKQGDDVYSNLTYKLDNPAAFAVLRMHDADAKPDPDHPEREIRPRINREIHGKGETGEHSHGWSGEIKRGRFELIIYPDYQTIKVPYSFKDVDVRIDKKQ